MSSPDPASSRDPIQDPNGSAKLDAEAQNVIFKARRSFGMSLAILMLGFIAIAVALVYRSMRTDGVPEVRYGLSEIILPADAALVSAVPSEGMVAVTYNLNGQTVLRLIDGKTGTVLRDIPISQR